MAKRLVTLALATVLAGCGGGGGGSDDQDTSIDGEDVVEDVPDEDGAGPTTFEGEVRVEGASAFAIRIDPAGALLPDPVPDPTSELTERCASAVAAAPEPMRQDLARTLWNLDLGTAETFAGEILSADPLQADEVAWSIATTAPEILEWIAGNGDAGLFRENAQGVYDVDGSLLYARLVELGDGRTTLEVEGEAGTYQLEPDDYYYYVVAPRAYFELPMYVDGYWWRTTFRATTPYAPDIVGSVATATTLLEAADQVGDWIQTLMTFGYDSNLIQPVEIYFDRYGSCGEYSIITTAAARTVLIPATSVSARADDHEWNEFWDGRWIMWDNSLGEIGTNPHYPYIDWPEIMDDDLYSGAGVFGEVAHVFRWRSDESIFACDQYTPAQDVTITVTDATGMPVEGARVIARSAESSYLPCTWSYTDHLGRALFTLGDDLRYGFTTDHPLLGQTPPTGVSPSLNTVQGGDPLSASTAFAAAIPRTLVDAGPPPTGDLSVSLSFQVLSTLQHRTNVLTEPYELGETYPASFDSGVVDFFVLDQAAYDAFLSGAAFDAHSVHVAQESGTLDVTLPSGQDWYLVVDNAWWPQSTKFVSISAASTL